MGKNKRKQIEFFDSFHNQTLQCDSDEECDFIAWLLEAQQLGVAVDFKYQPQTYVLSEAVKYTNAAGKQRTLLREHVYSPDFEVMFNPTNFKKLAEELHLSEEQAKQNSFTACIDVKGTFAKADAGRTFAINQKWLMQRHNVYVCKIVPKDFFQKFGVPQACILTKKTKKPRKMFLGCPQMDLALFS